MEVTRLNFPEVLIELDGVLKNATFLGIDGEFTGLNSGPDAKPFDTPAQYYEKVRSGSMDFLLVQFGLSVFTYHEETEQYSHRTYNFYVFPRPLHRSAPDCRFMCQASSITFLANQGFDFNKLFRLGIPYLTANDEKKMHKKLEEKKKIREEGIDTIVISNDDKPQVEEICARIEEFLHSDDDELVVDRCNAYIRRVIHQEVRMRWPKKIRVESRVDGTIQSIVAYKIGTKEEEQKKEAERQKKEKLEVEEAVGLSALLRKIADSGKLIVGHNMLLDLCHIIHQFFGDLPETYEEFKELIHNLFPRLVDTKILSQSNEIKDIIPSSILNHMFKTVSQAPFTITRVIPVPDRSYSTSDETYHQAGYDAYVTGLCFIAMSNYLGSLQSTKIPVVLPDSSLLEPFINKLTMVRLKDYPHIDLVGDDPKPNRDYVFHVTFPKEWKQSNLSQLFMSSGGAFVSWLSDTTAYAGLYRRENAAGLIKKLKKSGQLKNVQIQSYSAHQASLEQKQMIDSSKGDRKRKQRPSENSTATNDSQSAKAEKTDEQDWELAPGKRRRKHKQLSTGNGNKIVKETT